MNTMTNTGLVNILEPTTIFVPKFKDMVELWRKHERAHWNTDEADMRTDIEQWNNGKITEGNKAFIKMNLRLFTQSDFNVCGSYVEKLLPIFRQADARVMLLGFAGRECTHMHGYKMLNDTLGYDTEEFASEFMQYEQLKAKHEFMIRDEDLSTEMGIAKYLVKQILMEGVSLFGPFCMLLSQKPQGKLPGMVSVNKWSIIEESMHVEGLNLILQNFLKQFPQLVNDDFKSYAYRTYTEVIGIEEASIKLAYSVGTNEGMTEQEAIDYVRFVGDYRMNQMGFKGQYGIEENPIPWIDGITGKMFGNFFEVTITEYSKSSLVGDWVYPEWIEPTSEAQWTEPQEA